MPKTLSSTAKMISEVSKRQRYALNLLGIPGKIFLSKKLAAKKSQFRIYIQEKSGDH
jgi:hypothetical protein